MTRVLRAKADKFLDEFQSMLYELRTKFNIEEDDIEVTVKIQLQEVATYSSKGQS